MPVLSASPVLAIASFETLPSPLLRFDKSHNVAEKDARIEVSWEGEREDAYKA